MINGFLFIIEKNSLKRLVVPEHKFHHFALAFWEYGARKIGGNTRELRKMIADRTKTVHFCAHHEMQDDIARGNMLENNCGNFHVSSEVQCSGIFYSKTCDFSYTLLYWSISIKSNPSPSFCNTLKYPANPRHPLLSQQIIAE